MERYAKLTVFFLVFSLIFSAVSAYQGFDVNIESGETKVDPSKEETAKFNISVTNRMDERRNFAVGFSTGTATNPSWYLLKNSMLGLEPNQTRKAFLYITPDRKAVAGNKGPKVYGYPTGSPENMFSNFITFTVSRDTDMVITEFESPNSSYKPSGRAEAFFKVKNVVQRDFSANRFEARFTLGVRTEVESLPNIDSGEELSVSGGVDLEGLSAGRYDFHGEIVDTENDEVVATREAKVKVEEDRDVSFNKKVDKGFLKSSYQLTLSNGGNTVVDKENVSTEVSWFDNYFMTFPQKPDFVVDSDDKKELIWQFESMEPGETVSVEFSKNYWSGVIVALIVLIVSFIVYKQLKSVSVVKFVNRKEEGYAVNVRIRNRTGRKVSKVKVEDFVPGIAVLVQKFDSRSPDKIQRTDEGTRIVWEVDSMEPGEERIFMYRIKPRIKVEGSVNLPEAVVEYMAKGRKLSDSSHSVSTDFK